MAYYIPKRSVGGCLTCKQRKKKCDETKPTCQRCNKGNFPCLGYSMPDDPSGQCQGIWCGHKQRASPTQDPADDPTSTRPGDLVPLSTQAISALDLSQGRAIRAVVAPPLVNFPQGIVLGTDSTATHEMASFVLNHYRARVQSILFKLPSIPIERGLQRRMLVSKTARWSLYLGARIAEDLSQGNNGQRYMSWVTCLYRHIMENSNSAGFEDKSLELRMASLRELTTWVFVVLGTSAGYLLFKNSATLFFQLSALSPETWTADGAVSIQGAMQTRHFEIRNYVLQDTIMAMVLGVPSIISYDVSLSWSEEASRQYLAWIYGIPAGLIILLANINSWRASCCVGHPNPNHDWRRIEKHLQGWSPDVDHSQEASDYIVRLAVQECWRQAALIYLYMGMCEVDSGDSRVKSGVRQVAQLAGTIGKDSSLMPHLFVPCLVAGAAARQERHRAVIRAKIMACRDLLPLTLRGGDFLLVLDHLWRGAASAGRPILWQDYVQSRCATLPLVP